MKNRYKKKSKHYIQHLFKKISQSKGYKYIIKWHYIIRLILGILFIIYWIVAFIIPFIPGAIFSIILGALIISGRVNFIKSKFLYFINYLRIKIFFLKIYEKYKIFKILIHKNKPHSK